MTDLDVHDMLRQLTEQHTHRELYVKEREIRPGAWVNDGERYHGTSVPALVLQLLAATPSVTGSGDLAGTQATSRPAARIEALDTVMLIDEEAGEWIDRLGGVIPADRIDEKTCKTIVGSGTLLRLQRLHGLHPSTKTCQKLHSKGDDGWCCDRGRLEHDVRRWWHQARIVAGWDMAAFKPDNTCPVCEQRGKLRIRFDSALCVECRTVWTVEQMGLLAEHIRRENRDEGVEPGEEVA